MNRYFYDMHLHSCLSPCSDNDMTPNNIAGMAKLNGLDILALTDHNSTKNCPAFEKCARKNGIIPICGMELTTSEDIHVICLFPSMENAVAFGDEVDSHRIKIPNRAEVFGEQLLLDENDELIGTEGFLLPNATDIMIDDVPSIVNNFGGICYPAHIDRESNGAIAVLGVFPDLPAFTCAEFHNRLKIRETKKRFPILAERNIIVSSDAHVLWDINEKESFFELESEKESPDIINELFSLLKKQVL